MNLKSVNFDPFAAPVLVRTTASTESQRELWTASQLGNDASAAFNEAISLRLTGSLDRRALTAALGALVASHEALHTSFSADGTSLLVEEPQIDLTFSDDAATAEDGGKARLQSELRAQVTDPFNLGKAPLLRARLLALGPEEHLLLISAHHIVCDGWSMSVLLSDLATLYTQAASGAKLALPERPRFSDYAEAEASRVSTDDYRAAERYWLDRFVGQPPVVDLPSDRPRPPLKTYASDRVDYLLDAELVARVKELGARRGTSFFATLLTAFKTQVHHLTGAEDIVVGIPAAGQSFTDRPTLVGHCVNMMPLRDFMGTVRRTLLYAYEH
jgi:hypothetical protein